MEQLIWIGLGGIMLGGTLSYLGVYIFSQKRRTLQVQQAAELNYLKESFQALQGKEQMLQHRLQEQLGEIHRLSAEREFLAQNVEVQQKEMARAQETMRLQFENLAQQVLDKKTHLFSISQENQLKSLLHPFKEQLANFEQKIAQTYSGEIRERIQLQKEIEVLVSLNQQLSSDAQNLTKALKGDNKFQGSWGELVLSRVLESSGLREGKEFLCQVNHTQQNGRRVQPDVVVYLPGKRHLIIDAKVSLKAYEQWISGEVHPEKGNFLTQHIESVQKHIKLLSDKHYQGISQFNSPEFVFLFMAVEPAFAVAIQHKPELFAFAWERKVVLVSPSSMVATLKTVASVWQVEYQNQNAQEIARQGGALYDKFVGFVEELEGLGKNLDRAQSAYKQALQKLHTGQGNLVDRAKRLRELGASSRKNLP